MGPCCVEGCEVISEDTYYFEFPTSRILRRKWLDVIPIPGKLPLGTVVCSRHFSADDYENIRGKVRLKRKVVPSLLLDLMKEQTKSSKTKELENVSSRLSPPRVIEPCDSTTVSVPSPNDGDKMMDDVKSCGDTGDCGDREIVSTEMAEICKVVPIENGRHPGYEIKLENIPFPDPKEDIEDMITNYHIKNKVPNPALLPDVPLPEALPVPSQAPALQPMDETIEIEDGNDAAPVFIEISVDKDTNTAGTGSQDCLMLLESVQVDVDPTTLILDQDYEHEEEKAPSKKKDDPISLLTSSDEDDVIIQEPHIDTVEVSDDTDEDDMPLVKLVKKKPQKKKSPKKKRKIKTKLKEDLVEKKVLDGFNYYCIQCRFTTECKMEYNNHVAEHSTVLQVCPICSYTSASNTMFIRHMKKHKEDKKFQCHLCDYRAKHNMSLIYHLQSHDSALFKSVKNGFKCQNCGYMCNDKSVVLEHVRMCHIKFKLHACDKCQYRTCRMSDLRRHKVRKHKECEDDEEYMPEA